MITNDEKAEMADEGQVEFPNDGLDEVVGEKLAIRSQTGLGSLQSTRTKAAKKIDEAETKVVRCRYGLS